MSNLLAEYGITPEREREMWRKQNIADLMYWADLPLTTKLELIEGMEDFARAFHKGRFPNSPDEHEEPWGTLKSGKAK